MALVKGTNGTLKGPYKTPKYRCWGLDNGVPFTKTYRSKSGISKLKKQPGITNVEYSILH